MEKREFLLFSTILYYLLSDFHVKKGSRFSLRDKRLFETSEVEIMRVDCILLSKSLNEIMIPIVVI